MTQHTKDFLAQELRAAGLDEMADKAATGYYRDFLSPITFPEMQLLLDLRSYIGTKSHNAVQKLIARHINGEFDASREESDEWAASEDGQAAFTEFTEIIRK